MARAQATPTSTSSGMGAAAAAMLARTRRGPPALLEPVCFSEEVRLRIAEWTSVTETKRTADQAAAQLQRMEDVAPSPVVSESGKPRKLSQTQREMAELRRQYESMRGVVDRLWDMLELITDKLQQRIEGPVASSAGSGQAAPQYRYLPRISPFLV